MDIIKVLDCTLRDGGYCNDWKFGNTNIKKIVNGLIEAGIDIVECGFLTDRVTYNKDISKFTTVEEVASVIPKDRQGKSYVCMVNYGEYSLDNIPDYDGSSIDGLRVAFHKKDLIPALKFCEGIKSKGYKVYVQAMVSLSYSDEEFLRLIQYVNELEPYSFYIVDSFGVMKRKDLTRLFYMVEHNLAEGIAIGYHSHNNMQLAYANAQTLVDIRTKRELILDSSVFGMGRGAGNLNTELFVEYLNDNIGTNYKLQPLLTIIDEILNKFYQENYWGYSLPNYLSAKHNSHPNYARYLDAKTTLTVENMDEIFMMLDDSKRADYDKEYIENLYLKYMEKDCIKEERTAELKGCLEGKSVLVIAPGKSSMDEREKVIARARDNGIITISINYEYDENITDFIFVSNLRRYRELAPQKHSKCLVTSNIPAIDVFLQIRYKELLNDTEMVRDNAGMMLIKFLMDFGVQKIYIAGIDGYSVDPDDNYANREMNIYNQRAVSEAINAGMTKVLREYSKKIDIEFITTPRYVHI